MGENNVMASAPKPVGITALFTYLGKKSGEDAPAGSTDCIPCCTICWQTPDETISSINKLTTLAVQCSNVGASYFPNGIVV